MEGLEKMLVMSRLEVSTKVLEILILRSYYPPKLIMLFLDKITKGGMLKSNISTKGGFSS